VLLPVLTVIGTGIGAIGFVIFFGGFIVWSRFDAAGLPANEAVAHVPRADLVATGASFLVPAILAALATAALAVAGRDFAIGSKDRDRSRRIKKERLLATQVISGLEEEQAQLERTVVELQKKEEKGEEGAALARKRCQEDLDRLRDEEIRDAKEDQRTAAAEQTPAGERSSRRRNTEYALGLGPMLLAEGIIVGITLAKVSFIWSGLLLLGVTAVTIVIAVAVASMTERFAWYTLCVFLGVGVTIAFATHVRTQSNPKISPLVALHGRLPVTGFFLAETPDAVYIGRPKPDWTSTDDLAFEDDGAIMLRLPKEALSALAIGPLMDERQAYRRSTLLAVALCHRPGKRTRGQSDGATRCAPGARHRLLRRLAMIEALH
jgi:hypothetical protein